VDEVVSASWCGGDKTIRSGSWGEAEDKGFKPTERRGLFEE